MELAHDDPFVALHFAEFHSVHRLLHRIAGCRRMTPPDLALHIVLKQHTRNDQASREIHSSVQKVAYRHIETLLPEPSAQLVLHFETGETADCIRWLGIQMDQVIQCARNPGKLSLASTHCDCP